MSFGMKPLDRRRTVVGLTGVVAVLALGAAPAVAQTTLFQEDAEGPIDAKWTVIPAQDNRIQPWQKSDSSAPKARGNQRHGGATSYWTGGSAPFEPTEVVKGDSIMQTKQTIVIPADGTTTLSFWSLYQNEGDDTGLVEAAVDTGGALAWKRVAVIQPPPSAAGEPYVAGYCDPTHPAETAIEPFAEVKGNFDAFKGERVFLRFNMRYGAENRSATQPCGWYVDDIVISTTGTPGNTGGGGGGTATPPPATPAPAGPAGPPAAKPGLRVTKLRGKGRKATLSLTVTGGPIRKASVVLLRGKKKLARGRAASLAAGKRTVKLKGKSLKRGKYSVQVTGTGPDGKPFSFKASARLR